MKVKKVSALRVKRRLHRMNGAEPPVVARTPQTTDILKTDAMTPNILRQPKPVEPEIQAAQRSAFSSNLVRPRGYVFHI